MDNIAVIDLGFGDSGKGTIIDFLTQRNNPEAIIKFNGSSQAAHNVVLPDGVHHCFAQVGSGSLISETVNTVLTKEFVFDPIDLLREEKVLRDLGIKNIFNRFHIEHGIKFVTPYHRAANRIREILRGKNRHGSCGAGLSEVMMDHTSYYWTYKSTNIEDIIHNLENIQICQRKKIDKLIEEDSAVFKASYQKIKDEYKVLEEKNAKDMAEVFQEVLSKINVVDPYKSLSNNCLFEGSQGILLDQDFGFHPHTTWSRTKTTNAFCFALRHRMELPKTIGVLRWFLTRHGHGPFPTEDEFLTNKILKTQKEHNQQNEYQGKFRAGWADFVLYKYALEVLGGIDGLALTWLDEIKSHSEIEYCKRYGSFSQLYTKAAGNLDYQQWLCKFLSNTNVNYNTLTNPTSEKVISLFQKELSTEVVIKSYGPTFEDKV